MEQLRPLFDRYDRLLIFDTETTGLDFVHDEIIQFSAVSVECSQDNVKVAEEYDRLLLLAPGKQVPPEITRLTGITTEEIAEHGISRAQACREIGALISGNTLLVAYNAHFDLSFLFYLFAAHGDPGCLKGKDKLDLLTVYRDRHSYPHRLKDAIDRYGLSGRVVNSHRAVDDVIATLAVARQMENEKDDLESYVNLFGYNPKYGISGKAIGSVTYRPQCFDPVKPLYEFI